MARKPASRRPTLPPAPPFLSLDEAIGLTKKKGPKPDPKILGKLGVSAAIENFAGGVLSRTVEDETLSGRRMNANDAAWLLVSAANIVDGDSGQIAFLDTGFGNAILTLLWIPLLKPNTRYLFQMRAVVQSRQPDATGITIVAKGKGSAGPATSVSVFAPPANHVPFVATAFLTAEDTEPFVIFAGDRLSWTAYDIRIQHVT